MTQIRVIGASFDMPVNSSFSIAEIYKVLAHTEPYCPTICLGSISFSWHTLSD